ncbi:hypothetical protein O0L34_g14460 [Tuta absoluta]|nr:hypothetical protein O0L34_g14460 [Tuta absoluta]
MNDPWNVKSVRLGNQYSSCIKIHGVPLLPPVLSAECRKEMQYYKLLAKEVENRISILKPYIESESESNYDATDAPDITESKENTPALQNKVENINNFITDTFPSSEHREKAMTPRSTIVLYKTDHPRGTDSLIETDVEIENQSYRRANGSPRNSPEPYEIPERDCDCENKPVNDKKTKENFVTDIINNQDELSVRDLIPLSQDGPSSLSSKSFTGSLNDIHADVSKLSQKPNLVRQRSYTVLNPSPQLLAHLEVQSQSTGIEMSSISMSESMTKLNESGRKRRSWDLETAKEKWSSMAKELKSKNIVSTPNDVRNNVNTKSMGRNAPKTSPYAKSHSLSQDRRGKEVPSRTIKSENGHTPKSANRLKGRSLNENTTSNNVSEAKTRKPSTAKKETPNKTVALVSESEDPATRVRELYEKLQKQQLMQMASLMEKQQREQQLLQQVFEEQNNILFKQLKTVCPKASIEVKQAWGDLKEDNDRGPVSLSQLINTSTPDNSVPSSPVSTLTETSYCISKCDNVLQKSREITNSRKKLTPKPQTTNSVRKKVSATPTKNTSRRLNYDTSSDVDPMLTDRTNDTMADLNVTFSTDHSYSYSHPPTHDSVSQKTYATRACSPLSPRSVKTNGTRKRTDAAIKHLEDNIHNSIDTMNVRSRSPTVKSLRQQNIIHRPLTAKELVAATKIVACAKGFLVRRLMRTERVQATVQTIRDALLCALQLHQDREGIRGADVDLHRRLIQQITAACYTLHDTFVNSTPSERCAIIAADRGRRQALATKQPTPRLARRNTREDVG